MPLVPAPIRTPKCASADAPPVAEQVIDRTRGLFGLLVATAGSRGAARRLSGSDERTLGMPRMVPTVEQVSRLGLALGLDARASLGIVGSIAQARRTADELRRDARLADLDDDAAELERIASQLGTAPDCPCDVGLAQLVIARARISRGDATGARHALEFALTVGLDAADADLAGQLGETIAGESRVGEPWSLRRARIRGAEHLAWIASCVADSDHCTVRAARRHAWHTAAQWIEHRISAVDAIPMLHQQLERTTTPLALGWTASIAAMAALTVPPEPSTLRLAVTAQLALDEAIDTTDGRARDLLLARRARVTLREWALRIRAGEADAAVIDPSDHAELTCARLRLSFEWSPWHFFHSSNSVLDALSGDGCMRGLVPSLHAMGAVAESRSEDPC